MSDFPAGAMAAVLSRSLAGVDWSAGVAHATLLEMLEPEPALRRLLRRQLPDGVYFSIADIAAALPDEATREPGTWAPAAISREPFDGLTPEGLGTALRAAAMAFDARPASWLGAVIRSSILPGWGQWHNGQPVKAIAFAAALLLLGLASGVPVAMSRARRGKQDAARRTGVRPWWWVLVAVTYVAAMGDAFVSAARPRA